MQEEGINKTVQLGNDSTLAVTAKGSVRVEINGTSHVISDVYYVPELKTNLLSLGQLQEKGLSILIQNGMCKVFHSKRGLILRDQHEGKSNVSFNSFTALPLPTNCRNLRNRNTLMA